MPSEHLGPDRSSADAEKSLASGSKQTGKKHRCSSCLPDQPLLYKGCVAWAAIHALIAASLLALRRLPESGCESCTIPEFPSQHISVTKHAPATLHHRHLDMLRKWLLGCDVQHRRDGAQAGRGAHGSGLTVRCLAGYIDGAL